MKTLDFRTWYHLFDKDLCLFCQVDLLDESLYIVRQKSQKQSFRNRFLECPTSLKLYKICSSHAYDAVIGDIKYRNSSWQNFINKLTSEVHVQLKSCSHCLEVKEIYEYNVATDENVKRLDISDSDQIDQLVKNMRRN